MINPEQLTEKIVRYCTENAKTFLYISGNGASGKTELSKLIAKEVEKTGIANIINTDDFVVETQLRKSAKFEYEDLSGKALTGRYTTSIEPSYFLQNLKAIIFNLQSGNDYFHWPKKAESSTETILLRGNAELTIIEGIATTFLNRNDENSLSIFIQCSDDIELSRRIERKQASNEQNEESIRESDIDRRSQFEVFVKPHIRNFNLILESKENYDLEVIRDKNRVLD